MQTAFFTSYAFHWLKNLAEMEKQRLALFLIISFCFSSCHEKGKSIGKDTGEIKKLRNLFSEWKKGEIAEGRIWAEDSCNGSWMAERHFESKDGEIEWGFPDSSEFLFYYADLNLDGKLDQLVTFSPAQCDGGNGSMWTQIEVLTVSENGSYKTRTLIGDGIFSSLGKDKSGFYWYDSIGPDLIYATFYNFKDGDGHCCPSVKQAIVLKYDSLMKIVLKRKQS